MSQQLLEDIRSCKHCERSLNHVPRPIVNFSKHSRVLIIGQAPGAKVHASGIPWDDASGKTLRSWLGVESGEFYNPDFFGIVPMGFCYPGKGTSGDLPPRPECAPLWHQKVLKACTQVKLTILIGQHAQKYHLGENVKGNLTETVRSFRDYIPRYFVLPHPSPRNRFWMVKNPWFEDQVIPVLKEKISELRA